MKASKIVGIVALCMIGVGCNMPHSPAEQKEIADRDAVLESVGLPLSGRPSLFGLSGYGRNYSCVGTKCTCSGGVNSDDCTNLAFSGDCKNGTFGCNIAPPHDCSCTYDPGVPIIGGTGCAPNDNNCVLVSFYVNTGIYRIGANTRMYKIITDRDRACLLKASQYANIGSPYVQGFGDGSSGAAYIANVYSGQTCTNEEAGVTHGMSTFTNGIYRTDREATPRNLKLYKDRACALSTTQYQSIGSPAPFHLADQNLAILFTNSFYDSGDAAPCRDMEIFHN